MMHTPHTAPAARSSRLLRGVSSAEAVTTQSSTHGTAAQSTTSVPHHGGGYPAGVTVAITTATHHQTRLRLASAERNDSPSRPHPHQPSMVATAPCSLTMIGS